MTMPRCETCRHWRRFRDAWDAPYHIRDALFPHNEDYEYAERDGAPVGECQSPRLVFCEAPPSEMGAATYDGSQYMGGLITAHLFGCVNHEPSEP